MHSVRAGLLAAERAAAEAVTLRELAERAFAPLAAALDAPVIGCYEMGAGGAMTIHYLPGLEATFREFQEHYRGSDPLQEVKRRLNPRLAVTTDLVDRKAFHRSAIYNELYVRLDVEHHLMARLSTVGYGVPGCVAVAMARAARQRSFSPADLRAVARVLPAFEAAVRRSARVAQAEQRTSALAAILEQGGSSSYLLLDGAGALVWRSPRAARLCPGPPPAAAADAARRLAALATARELPAAPAPFLLDLGGPVPLRAEAFLVRDPERTAPLVAIRIDDGAALAGALAELARRARLTPGEAIVLGKLARGGSNRDLAAQLHVSPETVRTHVGRILRKLGVKTRLEAVIRLRDLERERMA